MKIIKKYQEDQDQIIMIKNMIDTYFNKKNFKKVGELIELLKNKYGVDYNPYIKDKKEVTLEYIYSVDDFTSWGVYTRYCYDIFTLRFNLYKSLLINRNYGYIITERVKEVLAPFGIKVEEVSIAKNGYNASVVGDTLKININGSNYKNGGMSKETIIHEIAHLFENKNLSKIEGSILENMGYASSNYLMNGSEVFAEHFKNFFLEPSYLRRGWQEIYNMLDRLISSSWKKLVGDILDS